jgi:hypothetical protein
MMTINDADMFMYHWNFVLNIDLDLYGIARSDNWKPVLKDWNFR